MSVVRQGGGGGLAPQPVEWGNDMYVAMSKAGHGYYPTASYGHPVVFSRRRRNHQHCIPCRVMRLIGPEVPSTTMDQLIRKYPKHRDVILAAALAYGQP